MPMMRLPNDLTVNEGETVVPTPTVVEPFETELPSTGVAPETENVSAAEETEPGVMKEDHRSLTLHVGIFDPEVESILVHRPLKAPLSRLGYGFF